MTYNIRYDNPADSLNGWGYRKDKIVELIRYYEPDFLGIQEGLTHQVKYLDENLEQYSYVGVGRDDGHEKGEYAAIFYRSDKYKLLTHSHFWLSKTPSVPSLGWDAACVRICTYAQLQDKATRQKVWVFNTHFDHVGDVARAESARLILHRIDSLTRQDKLPVILTGDFNLTPEREPVSIIKGLLNDSHDVSKVKPYGPEGTFNGFRFADPPRDRIDYIFVSKSLTVDRYIAIDDFYSFRYPSDHLPVMAYIQQ
jgi:endonuclease/exonuclease/phosphatase family metal-dependent hydrolase